MTVALEKSAPEGRRISILGSTGSIGCSTLDLVRRNRERFDVVALTGNRNLDLLIEQAREFGPEFVGIADEGGYDKLASGLAGTGIDIAAGPEALEQAASLDSDWIMAGIVGAAGLRPTLQAVRRGKVVALANKECLVCSGALFLDEVKKSGATLLPVDSEHNAIFQVFEFERADAIEKIILTASGGPFRQFTLEQMAAVTPEQAVKHPNWSMGAKISIDSATMMNKGLELIEAYFLFPVAAHQIDILVHPQSVVHSMVAYIDGSVLAQLGSPDMRTPIAYSLAWPQRMPAPAEPLDLAKVGELNFETPDLERFPSIRLAREALETGGLAPAVLNAANEVAVQHFLENEIAFLDIARIVDKTLETVDLAPLTGLNDVFGIDNEARRVASEFCADRTKKG